MVTQIPFDFRLLRFLFPCILLVFFFNKVWAQNDTVSTFTFGNTSRSGVFLFPNNPNKTYDKIKLLYRMRCKNGLVSTTTFRNQGCGEWDYSCNTYITDSSLIDSVKATHPSHIISGFSGTSFNYAAGVTHQFTEYRQRLPQFPQVSDTVSATMNPGLDTLHSLFSANKTRSKTQWLISQDEMLAAGFSAGNISGIDLELTQTGLPIRFLRIKIKATTKTGISSIEDSAGFVQVYFQETTFTSTGNQRLYFYRPFFWNGTSNLVVEISYSNPAGHSGNLVKGASILPFRVISNQKSDRYLEMDGISGQIDCSDIDVLDSASRFTFEAWVNIKAWQNWSGIFKDNGKTVLETGDQVGQLYCIIRNPNNTYGYANNVLPLNTWTHVAMVFDGTQNTNAGKLKLYINGVQVNLTYSGTIPSVTENNNTPLIIARGVNCRIDDPRVWSTNLEGPVISDWFRKRVSAIHPNFAQLQAAYDLDESNGNLLPDLSSFQRIGKLSGHFQLLTFMGHELFKNLEEELERPGFAFIRQGFPASEQTVLVLDSTPKLANNVVRYQLVNGQPVAMDTAAYYQSGNQNVLNEQGQVIRTINAPTVGTFNISTLNYFARSPQKIELLSFVTPYGIGIDFGMGGKVWEFDMSDFAPVLKGWKRISMERGGENQEEMDLKFVFIEGTPPRKVLSAQQIWPVTHSSYADIAANRVFEERLVPTLPLAQHFKVRSVVTGHGQEGEFIPRNHSLNINGGNAEFNWQAWTYCGTNPVYPQGGTWVYDRAGWCPGAPSDLNEWSLNAHLQPGSSHSFDYSVSPATGDSRYIANHQLIQYGPANFNLDAAIVQVNVPGQLSEYGRRNPACMHPEVVIQNTGNTPLTSLVLSYGLEGTTPSTFNWTGNLAFMEKTTVTLPLQNMGGSLGQFVVSCSLPNGGSDEYSPNNSVKSTYSQPVQIPQKFVIELKSNSAPGENEYQLLDAQGNIVIWKNSLAANTIYRDTMDLAPGCYEFILRDDGNNGLSWWANTAQGTGYIRFRSATNNAIIRAFNADFGGEIYQQFLVNPSTANHQLFNLETDFQVYPNPASNQLTINIGQSSSREGILEIIDVYGRVHFHQADSFLADDQRQISIQHLANGTYFVTYSSGSEKVVRKLLKW